MKTTESYPRMQPTANGIGTISQAGGLLLTETVRATGLDTALRAALAPWRKPSAAHDPAKTCTDLAIALTLGGDCLADAALLRAEPALYGPVASDPTVSRTITALAAEPDRALTAIRAARAHARETAWTRAVDQAPPDADGRVVVDIDATLLTAHSEQGERGPHLAPVLHGRPPGGNRPPQAPAVQSKLALGRAADRRDQPAAAAGRPDRRCPAPTIRKTLPRPVDSGAPPERIGLLSRPASASLNS